MADDKKQRPHTDHSLGRKLTPALGVPIVPSPIEAKGRERGDPTPPPAPGTVTNEDLIVRINTVDKKHDDFAATTTLRLANIEPYVQRVPTIESKVDQVLLLTAEKATKRELASIDIHREHVHLESKTKELQLQDQTHAAKTRRERNLEILKVSAKIVGYLLSGGFIVHLIEHC